jgi:hypothetical protein
MHRIIFVFLAIGACLFGEEAKPRPKFTDFPVTKIYQGTPAPPRLVNQGQRTFRTMIRRGAKNHVEFAGHYTVPVWGCGTECVEFVIVDSTAGKVYDVPFSAVNLPMDWLEGHGGYDAYKKMEFYPDSRLLRFDGCPNERDCGYYDYIMVDGKGLKLIRKELLPNQYQPG